MKLKRIFAAMSAAFVMAFAMPLGMAVNAEEPGSASSKTQVEYKELVCGAGDKVTFDKYLIVDSGVVKTPKVDFEFEVSAGKAVGYSSESLKINPGTIEPAPSVGKASFDGDKELKVIGDSSPLKDYGGENKSLGKKYAVVPVEFSLENVKFKEPGIYRYVVKEKTDGVASCYTTATEKLVVDVYVIDKSENDPDSKKPLLALQTTGEETNVKPFVVISSIALTQEDSTLAVKPQDGGEPVYNPNKKNDRLVNEMKSHDLYFAKKVSGNQASRDKFFEFTVNISGLSNGAKLGVDIANAVAKVDQTKSPATKSEYNNKTNPTEIEDVDSDGVIEEKFYLQHDQYIIIKGIPEGAAYNVAEEKEDYKKTAANSITDTNKKLSFDIDNDPATDTVVFSDETSGTVAKDRTTDIYTGYLNEKDGIVPTGIVLGFAPVIIIGIAVTAGIIFLVVRRKKDAK